MFFSEPTFCCSRSFFRLFVRNLFIILKICRDVVFLTFETGAFEKRCIFKIIQNIFLFIQMFQLRFFMRLSLMQFCLILFVLRSFERKILTAISTKPTRFKFQLRRWHRPSTKNFKQLLLLSESKVFWTTEI